MDIGLKVKSCRHAKWINSGALFYSMVTISKCIIYLKVVKRLDLKCSPPHTHTVNYVSDECVKLA